MYPSLSLEMRSAQGFHADASLQDDATFGCRTAYDFERTACVLSLGKTPPTNYKVNYLCVSSRFVQRRIMLDGFVFPV